MDPLWVEEAYDVWLRGDDVDLGQVSASSSQCRTRLPTNLRALNLIVSQYFLAWCYVFLASQTRIDVLRLIVW